MQPDNMNKIKESFTIQASAFENKNMNFSKKEYLDYTVKCVGAEKTDTVLEVASGTCACGRAIAPYAGRVVCLDATPAMLETAKGLAAEENICNIEFVEGYAEQLPFSEEAFDIVITRLSFHHFTDIRAAFGEMYRVLKKGGKLVIIDMEATQEELREKEDYIETLRDISHVKNRSQGELEELYREAGCRLTFCEKTQIPVQLQAWMDLTKTPAKQQSQIRTMLTEEMEGGEKTGVYPYQKDGEIYFNQRWLMLIGIK